MEDDLCVSYQFPVLQFENSYRLLTRCDVFLFTLKILSYFLALHILTFWHPWWKKQLSICMVGNLLQIYTARTITKFSCIIWVHFIKRMLSEKLWSFRRCYSALFATLNLYAFVKHFFITCLNSSMLLCSRLWKWLFELLELLAFIAFLFTFAIFSSYLVFISAYSLNKKWNSPL